MRLFLPTLNSNAVNLLRTGVYVEVTSQAMRRLCEREGFALLKTLQHRQGAPETHIMVREPTGGATVKR